MVEHGAIANLVRGDLCEFKLSTADRVGHGSSHAYDSSLEEIWLALASGATLVVLDDEVARAGPDLVPWLERERVSVLCPPPTMLRAMGCRRSDGLLPHLSLLYVGGEALTRDVADVWGPGRRMVNGYGPTECAVTAIRGSVSAAGPIDIGRPVPGARAWVLDASLGEVADGETGELCIGGAGLARGYWNAPELTAEKFPVHPALGRLYRTGDLARRQSDGTFECLGRIDAQVKLRGHRVELEDVEAHLGRLPGVRAAACRVELPRGSGPAGDDRWQAGSFGAAGKRARDPRRNARADGRSDHRDRADHRDRNATSDRP
jgi:non-ribosomal peptide synthetase component F